jgi:serine/threonine protein phosphatase 1
MTSQDPHEGRLIAIGDIHGCDKALEALIDIIQPNALDTLVILGDFIDRGKDSRRVILLLLGLQKRCRLITLLGNHERMLLNALDGDPSFYRMWFMYGGIETLESYPGAEEPEDLPDAHIRFMREAPLYYETDGFLFMHANYLPDYELDQQPEDMLLWASLDILDVQPHQSGKTAIVGHTPQPDGDILDLGFVKCIDTQCHGRGCLTALDVRTNEIWQADKRGEIL